MMLRLPLALLTLLTGAAAHDDFISMPINPSLGVPGYPDCVRAHPEARLTVEEASMDLVCEQKGAGEADAIKIGCVGDSITAGVHSSGGIHPYPAQLQILLDASQGKVRPAPPPGKTSLLAALSRPEAG